jgi:hypothetical protein
MKHGGFARCSTVSHGTPIGPTKRSIASGCLGWRRHASDGFANGSIVWPLRSTAARVTDVSIIIAAHGRVLDGA